MSVTPDAHVRAIEPLVSAKSDELIALRRHLHAHPELSHHEVETTRLLAQRLTALGFEVRVRPEGVGLLADLRAPNALDDAPRVAIRADLDALPIEEQSDTIYRSTKRGVMHACGHDVHMSCAMGAAHALLAIKDQLPGHVRIVYQHAEESSPSGGDEMIAFGALDDVDAIIALHCDPERPAGTIGVKDGALTAAYDRFEFKVHGDGGHGARPHQSVDPVYAAVQLIQALYQMAGRHLDARDPVSLSVGTIHGGDAPNVIPDVVTFSGTVRTVSTQARARIAPLLRQLADAACALNGSRYELDLYHGSPAVLNHPTVMRAITRAAEALLGRAHVHLIPLPSMGSEDFAHYLAKRPGAMFRLGTARAGEPIHLLHTPRFDIDEQAIMTGATLLASAALDLLHGLREDRDMLRASGGGAAAAAAASPHTSKP